MKYTLLLLCSMAAAGFADSAKLTLEKALQLARTRSPALRATRLQTQAAQKAVEASGRWKNPELEFDAEGVGGELDGFDNTEYTLSVSQTFERGGKRRHGRAAAEKAVGIAFQAEAEEELALLADVRAAFVEVMAQQEIGKVREEQEELARAFLQVAETRFKAGGASRMEVVQAELQLEEAVLAQSCCFGDLAAARTRLAALIGMPEKEMGELTGSYYALEAVDPLTKVDTHPRLQRIDAQIAVLRAEAARAQASDAADITLGAGYRYDAAGGINTLVFSAGMPLNFVRPGRAAEAAALMQADALAAEREAVRRRLQGEYAALAAQYNGTKLEAELVRARLIPKAEEAYALVREGYEKGRYSWVELIASQQHLAEIRVREIEALKDAHLYRAQLYRFMKEGI